MQTANIQDTHYATNNNFIRDFKCSSPSFSNFENCSRNLDMQELDYNPSKKDLTDARIHHLLAEELKPYKRVSYSDFFLNAYHGHAHRYTSMQKKNIQFNFVHQIVQI